MLKNKFNFVKLPLLLISSIFLFLIANPGVFFKEGCGPFAWICFVPLFLSFDIFTLKKSFVYGFFYGFFSYIFLCPWLRSFGLSAIGFVVLYYGLLYGILFFVLKSSRMFFSDYSFLVFPLIFTAFELFRSLGFLGFSYGNIGYTQYKNLCILTLAHNGSVYTISFLIYLVNSLVAFSFGNLRNLCNLENIKKEKKLILIPSAAVFLGLVSAFVPKIIFSDELSSVSTVKNINVSLIQNYSSADSNNIQDFEKDAGLLMNLTDKALKENSDTDLVVWAETAVVPDFYFHLNNKKDEKRHEISKKLNNFFVDSSRTFLFGNNHRCETFDKLNFYNSAVLFQKGRLDFYNKNHLVPFTEYIPPVLKKKSFNFLLRLFSSDDYDMEKSVKILKMQKNGEEIPFGVLICFEDSFPEIARAQKKQGAEFLVNITDDSWAKSEACQNLHLSMSVLRAVENDIPVLRSSISGATCFIDRKGRITKKLEAFTDGFLYSQVEIIP